jgi:branched-chain amino acid transport system permease protein
LVKSAHLPLGWSILIIIAGTIVIGLFLNYFLVTPLLDKNVPGIMIIIGTYAGALVVSGSAGALTDFAFMGTPPILPLTQIKIWIFPIVPQYGLCILVTIGVVVAYWYFLNRTHVGWAFKATSINRDMCRLLGISTSRMIAMAFAMSAGIGAIAGLLIGPMSSVNASMGFPVMVNGFIASVLGGMGNPYAAVVGGWVVGILHVLIAGYLAPGYAQLAVFLLLIGILYVRPYGLFGVHED